MDNELETKSVQEDWNTDRQEPPIIKALINFHKEVGKIAKNSTNPFFKSSYAALPDILSVIDPILIKNGLVVVQTPTGRNRLKTVIYHESGGYIEGTYEMTPKDDTPQGIGSTITYARRYALAAMLSLNIADEDDDGNIGSGNTLLGKMITESQKKNIKELLLSKKGKTVAEFEEATRFKLDQLTETKARELISKLQSLTSKEINERVQDLEDTQEPPKAKESTSGFHTLHDKIKDSKFAPAPVQEELLAAEEVREVMDDYQ